MSDETAMVRVLHLMHQEVHDVYPEHFFIRDNFLVATAIGAAIMLFFMGVGHVLDIRKNRNISPYNAGSVVYFDLLLPLAMIVLLVLWKTGY